MQKAFTKSRRTACVCVFVYLFTNVYKHMTDQIFSNVWPTASCTSQMTMIADQLLTVEIMIEFSSYPRLSGHPGSYNSAIHFNQLPWATTDAAPGTQSDWLNKHFRRAISSVPAGSSRRSSHRVNT